MRQNNWDMEPNDWGGGEPPAFRVYVEEYANDGDSEFVMKMNYDTDHLSMTSFLLFEDAAMLYCRHKDKYGRPGYEGDLVWDGENVRRIERVDRKFLLSEDRKDLWSRKSAKLVAAEGLKDMIIFGNIKMNQGQYLQSLSAVKGQ